MLLIADWVTMIGNVAMHQDKMSYWGVATCNYGLVILEELKSEK
ncbi:hypothetical protein DYBT9623_03310 [Dyadobacter sp. CECT 9623]|uniref:Uncharacterized protein n=1 Tax=Dyadobacter linearis TaxID=2823330 RepID=A0ABM8UT81_9BACT|nr:hypothetical protein DYBT9623_03310 [Dyadobacter sp. CECT 9623]